MFWFIGNTIKKRDLQAINAVCEVMIFKDSVKNEYRKVGELKFTFQQIVLKYQNKNYIDFF